MNIRPFKLERYFAQHEFRVRRNLCASDCETFTVSELLELEPGARKAFDDLCLGYTESQGAPALRSEISKIYESIDPDQILIHSGAEEGIFLFMHAALLPGDHVVVHFPCYESLAEIARSIGCAASAWIARENHSWEPDPEDLERLLRPNTKVIVLNTPHNPTGYQMPAELFREVSRIVARRNLVLLSDEVYRDSEHDPRHRLPAACDLGSHAVSLGVLSKSYGLPGLRIGWTATHRREILERMSMLKDYTTICASAPSELLAEIALRHHRTLLDRNRQLLSTHVELVDRFISRHEELFTWVRPAAGSVGFPRLQAGGAEAFCRKLVEDAGVLLLPGTVFGYEDHFRIGFGRADLPQALGEFEEFLVTKRPSRAL